MTPQEKAKELVDKFKTKEIALMVIEETLDVVDRFGYDGVMYYKMFDDGGRRIGDYGDALREYYQVKQEIEKL